MEQKPGSKRKRGEAPEAKKGEEEGVVLVAAKKTTNTKKKKKRAAVSTTKSLEERAASVPEEEEEEEVSSSKRLPLKYVNKQRLLVVGSRGITARQRHLMEDLTKLLPHFKAEAKFESKGEPRALNEICEFKSCNGVLYLESRKRTHLYAWLGRPPNGPSLKFEVLNAHTMDELRLTGNCGLGTRPLLCFDRNFLSSSHWKLSKELLTLAFGAPRGHPKTKPFFDRAMSFSIVDDAIWVRHFQIIADDDDQKDEDLDLNLVEIGPRFVLAPARFLAASFKGATVFSDPTRAALDAPHSAAPTRSKKAQAAQRYQSRLQAKTQRKEHLGALR